MSYLTELSTARCRLRKFEPADAQAVYRAVKDSLRELRQWMPWCHAEYSLADSEAWVQYCIRAWESSTEFQFAVLDNAGFLMGAAGLNLIDWTNRRANLGYWIRTSHTGQGFATAATKLVAAFALDELKLNRIEIVAAVGNEASLRVAESAGAVQEGISRERFLLQGTKHHAAIFSFISRDRKKLPPLQVIGEENHL